MQHFPIAEVSNAGFSSMPIVDILRVGFSGIVFLLALMSFRLLSGEQKKTKPSLSMLKMIKSFLWICVLLAILVPTAGIVETIIKRNMMLGNISSIHVQECRDDIERLDTYLNLPESSVDGLKINIEKHLMKCDYIIDQLEKYYEDD